MIKALLSAALFSWNFLICRLFLSKSIKKIIRCIKNILCQLVSKSCELQKCGGYFRNIEGNQPNLTKVAQVFLNFLIGARISLADLEIIAVRATHARTRKTFSELAEMTVQFTPVGNISASKLYCSIKVRALPLSEIRYISYMIF